MICLEMGREPTIRLSSEGWEILVL